MAGENYGRSNIQLFRGGRPERTARVYNATHKRAHGFTDFVSRLYFAQPITGVIVSVV